MAHQKLSFGDMRAYPEMVARWPDYEFSERWMIDHRDDFIFDFDHIIKNATTIDNMYSGNDSGIYILINDSTVVYVGQSKRIATRILAHADPLRKELKQFTHHFVISVPHHFLDDVERYYIDELEPILNISSGRGSWKWLVQK